MSTKRVKMVLYGEPGVGKSVFAAKAPKPFFICTDGNYAWLEDFGVDPNAHKDVNSWAEIKELIDHPEVFDPYETIVLDLTEDAFKWTEFEYCVRNKIEHISDFGYGKGYDATRTEFFVNLCKLIALDKHVIFIMHGITYVQKDRRGVEHTKYGPTSRIPDKVIDQIEGRVRYFLRAYVKDTELEDGTVIKNRYLSLVPKPNEFGIIRGVNENTVPQDIPLDWNEFADIIGLNVNVPESNNVEVQETVQESAPAEEEQPRRRRRRRVEEVPAETPADETEVPESVTNPPDPSPAQAPAEVVEEPVKEAPKAEPAKAEPAPQVQSNADKLAAIKAKLAAMKAGK